MKSQIINKSITVLLSLSIQATLLLISSCGGKSDPGPSAQDLVKAKLLANSWVLQSVMVDGIDQTVVYKGLTLKFTATNYNTTNGGVIWPASGTWLFNSIDGKTIKRDDGTIISVEATDSSLKLAFTWSVTTLSGGKVNSLKGMHIFTFVK